MGGIMRREWILILAGASMLAATEVEAQRHRDRERDEGNRERVERLEPVRAPGRVVAPPVRRPTYPAHVDRRHDGHRRVVYSSRGHRPRHRGNAWVRVDWTPRLHVRPVLVVRPGAVLSQGELRRMLGKRAVRDIRDAGFSMGLRGRLRGHWVHQRGFGIILVVTMGGSDVAEFVDYDRDGFLDEAYLVGPRVRGGVAIGW
ncbi:MAG: hypothetical protein AMS19_05855 [Gemmatimonas sp. SG8_23]|nr:MAG: hypothetical protein AMS19_05855 [Gemmatimonas sp. SG8_23]